MKHRECGGLQQAMTTTALPARPCTPAASTSPTPARPLALLHRRALHLWPQGCFNVSRCGSVMWVRVLRQRRWTIQRCCDARGADRRRHVEASAVRSPATNTPVLIRTATSTHADGNDVVRGSWGHVAGAARRPIRGNHFRFDEPHRRL